MKAKEGRLKSSLQWDVGGKISRNTRCFRNIKHFFPDKFKNIQEIDLLLLYATVFENAVILCKVCNLPHLKIVCPRVPSNSWQRGKKFLQKKKKGRQVIYVQKSEQGEELSCRRRFERLTQPSPAPLWSSGGPRSVTAVSLRP